MSKYVFATKSNIEKYKGFKSTMGIPQLNETIRENNQFKDGLFTRITRINLINHVRNVCAIHNQINKKVATK